jgi:DNA-binding PadR family transcriptional regulator
MREALLAMLSKEPSHGYQLHQRLSDAMGEPEAALNAGQVYVTLSRLERAGLVLVRDVEQGSRPDKKVYEATAQGREVAQEWLADTSWRKIAPVDFHLKLVAAAATGLADPVTLIDGQRRELLRRLAQAQRIAAAHPQAGAPALLAEGAALRLQADIRWLEACERHWVQGERG